MITIYNDEKHINQKTSQLDKKKRILKNKINYENVNNLKYKISTNM